MTKRADYQSGGSYRPLLALGHAKVCPLGPRPNEASGREFAEGTGGGEIGERGGELGGQNVKKSIEKHPEIPLGLGQFP